MIYLGLDIGTSSISLCVFDDAKDVSACRNVVNRADIKSGFSYEMIQEPEVIYSDAVSLLDAAISEYREIAGISLTGQMHGIVYLNKGKAVSGLYTWQDGRASADNTLEEIKEKTGYTLYAGYGIATHFFNMKHGLLPEKFDSFCTVADYIAVRMCSLSFPVIHRSNAASLGLYSFGSNGFDVDAANKLGIDINTLPKVCGDIIAGEYKSIPVTVAIGDNQAGFYGTVGEDRKTALANFGTGSQISFIYDGKPSDNPKTEQRPYIGDLSLLCGSALCGGRAYALLERFFSSYAAALGNTGKQYEIMNSFAARGIESRSWLDFDVRFCGERSDPDIRASINGISDENFTPEAFISGVLYGMCRELYDLYGLMPASGIERIKISGNAARKNPVLIKMFETVFNTEAILSDTEEEAALGAALFAKRLTGQRK